MDRIRGEIERFLEFGDIDNSAMIVSNLDWTEACPTLEFLREIGKHFPVSQMLARESVKGRLEAGGISYTEFSYQILQALDYLELYRRQDCTLQVGGSDQWGNLVAGVDLIRRAEGGSVHALATPLITKPDGTKYGKTEGGAIWISPDLMSPYAFYQFWLNVGDAEVPGLLKVFTFRSREEIEDLTAQTAERPQARVGQRTLAEDVTTLVHGADACQRVIAASRALFGQGDLREIDIRTLADACTEVPHTEIFLRAEPAGPGEGGGNAGGGAELRSLRSLRRLRLRRLRPARDADSRRPDGPDRDRAQQVGRQTRHRRGRRLPEQPEGHRRGRRPRAKRPPARSLPDRAPGQAHGRCRGRPTGLSPEGRPGGHAPGSGSPERLPAPQSDVT